MTKSQAMIAALAKAISRLSAPATVLAMLLITISILHAQATYPTRTIRILIGFGAGGATDIVARVLGAKLSDSLGQPVVIENRLGASGTVATEAVARAEPDGHTLLMTPLANAVNETLFKKFRYKFGEHLVAVAPVADTNNVLVVHPSLNVKSVSDLVALAKSRPPGEIMAATSGRGTAPHLALELFNSMAGVKLTAVHYKGGGDTVRDLITGEVKVMFATIAPIIEYINNGSMRAIATTGVNRDRTLPNLPTVIESGLPGFDVRLWIGLSAPAGTAPDVIKRLSAEIARAQQMPDVKATFAAQGFDPMIGSAEDFSRFYLAETAKWRKVIETSGLTAE